MVSFTPSISRDVLSGREPIVKDRTALRLAAPRATVRRGSRVDLDVSLYDTQARRAVAGQRVRIVRAAGHR